MRFLLLFSKLMLSIGIPKEIKPYEKRVSMIPEDIIELINYYKSLNKDIQVFIQKSAGINGGYSDEDYLISPSVILCDTIEEVYNKSKIIIKVKEPQPYEFSLIRDEHTIMAFFHFAANKELETFFNSKKTKCIVYETIKDTNNNYPILAPMSKIAGKQGLIVAHSYIIDNDINHNKNSLNISIIGLGNVGYSAFITAVELGYTNFNLIDINYEKLMSIKSSHQNLNITIMNSIDNSIDNKNQIKNILIESNIIISSIYNTGQHAERVINMEVLDNMKEGSIIIDIAIDQGGTTELSKPTTIENPFISYKNVKIYCVPNIPATVPKEASIEISKSILNYIKNNNEDTNDSNNSNKII